METSLHRALKEMYADASLQLEVPLLDYRIDAVADGRLVEVQHGSLAAIRDKVARLLKRHDVLVVKPIVVQKLLVKLDRKGGQVVERRRSPKRGRLLDLFDDLVYFTKVFPHRRLTLEAVLVDVEERRHPGHGRRRRWRRRDHQVEDQLLVEVREKHSFRTAADLLRLVPGDLPAPFHTGHLAQALGVGRWIAQRVAYCLRETRAVTVVGKQGNSHLYTIPACGTARRSG